MDKLLRLSAVAVLEPAKWIGDFVAVQSLFHCYRLGLRRGGNIAIYRAGRCGVSCKRQGCDDQ